MSVQWKDGKATIQFSGPDGKRRTLRLGKMTERNANRFDDKLDILNRAAKRGELPDDEVTAWVAKLGDDMVKKLATYGLVLKREVVPLGKLIADAIENHPSRKQQTKQTLRYAERNMVAFFC